MRYPFQTIWLLYFHKLSVLKVFLSWLFYLLHKLISQIKCIKQTNKFFFSFLYVFIWWSAFPYGFCWSQGLPLFRDSHYIYAKFLLSLEIWLRLIILPITSSSALVCSCPILIVYFCPVFQLPFQLTK